MASLMLETVKQTVTFLYRYTNDDHTLHLIAIYR